MERNVSFGISWTSFLPRTLFSSDAGIPVPGFLKVRLAFKADVISPDTPADLSILDEVYQMKRWGKDKNVSDRHDQIRKEICQADRLFRTL